jgi:regulator of RNase E activity RraA
MYFRIKLSFPRPSADLVQAVGAYPTGNICDAMNRSGAMNEKIRPMWPGLKIAGPALTVNMRPCDNAVMYKAMEIAQPGDILVFAHGKGTMYSATWGELASNIACAKGIGGLVSEGLVRDLEGLREVRFPVFAVGTTPNSPYKDGPGQVNFPIVCGDVLVNPGDIIVGDDDGVVVVPQQDAQRVLENLKVIAAKEQSLLAGIRAGQLIPDWVEPLLREKGCEFIE